MHQKAFMHLPLASLGLDDPALLALPYNVRAWLHAEDPAQLDPAWRVLQPG